MSLSSYDIKTVSIIKRQHNLCTLFKMFSYNYIRFRKAFNTYLQKTAKKFTTDITYNMQVFQFA